MMKKLRRSKGNQSLKGVGLRHFQDHESRSQHPCSRLDRDSLLRQSKVYTTQGYLQRLYESRHQTPAHMHKFTEKREVRVGLSHVVVCFA